VEWERETQINSKGGQLVWSGMARRRNRLRVSEEPCTICLEANTTAELFCGHQYHPRCIGAWLRKSRCCPCCRRQDIQGVKVYCRSCRWRYIVCTAVLVAKAGEELAGECESCMV
jgi:hypothetical protein